MKSKGGGYIREGRLIGSIQYINLRALAFNVSLLCVYVFVFIKKEI